LIAVAQLLDHIDVEPILLKGAIALLPDQYPGAEDRVIGDLDLLLPVDRIDEASEALRKTGYRVASLEHMLPATESGTITFRRCCIRNSPWHRTPQTHAVR